jgi:hypothetical protein
MDELLLLLILGFIILLFLLSFRSQWVFISNYSPSSTSQSSTSQSSTSQSSQLSSIVDTTTQNDNIEPSPPCINTLHSWCAKSTFGCCNDNITAKGDSIGINCP